jgi:hypothetical protein
MKNCRSKTEDILYPIQYEILVRAGNTLISEEKYKKYGEKVIIKHIKDKIGIDTKIEIIETEIDNGKPFFKDKDKIGRTIIIKRVKK